MKKLVLLSLIHIKDYLTLIHKSSNMDHWHMHMPTSWEIISSARVILIFYIPFLFQECSIFIHHVVDEQNFHLHSKLNSVPLLVAAGLYESSAFHLHFHYTSFLQFGCFSFMDDVLTTHLADVTLHYYYHNNSQVVFHTLYVR